MRSAAAAPPGGGAPLEGKHINVQPTIKNQVLTWSRDLTVSPKKPLRLCASALNLKRAVEPSTLFGFWFHGFGIAIGIAIGIDHLATEHFLGFQGFRV
jgi:hypothetical protein